MTLVFLSENNIAVSSAYSKTLQSDSIPICISFTSIKNSNGPSKLPCGTPHVTLHTSELTPLILTICFLLVRYDLNQETDSTPITFNFSPSML
jgi:hypothetical protein